MAPTSTLTVLSLLLTTTLALPFNFPSFGKAWAGAPWHHSEPHHHGHHEWNVTSVAAYPTATAPIATGPAPTGHYPAASAVFSSFSYSLGIHTLQYSATDLPTALPTGVVPFPTATGTAMPYPTAVPTGYVVKREAEAHAPPNFEDAQFANRFEGPRHHHSHHYPSWSWPASYSAPTGTAAATGTGAGTAFPTGTASA